jgi:hypothetical protein
MAAADNMTALSASLNVMSRYLSEEHAKWMSASQRCVMDVPDRPRYGDVRNVSLDARLEKTERLATTHQAQLERLHSGVIDSTAAVNATLQRVFPFLSAIDERFVASVC